MVEFVLPEMLAGPPRRPKGRLIPVRELPSWLALARLPPVTLRDRQTGDPDPARDDSAAGEDRPARDQGPAGDQGPVRDDGPARDDRPAREHPAVLSAEAVERLCGLIAVSRIGKPHHTIADVRALCTPESPARFAWAVFEQWRAAGFPPEDRFAMTALAVLGDDTTVPALTAELQTWANGDAPRVRLAVEALAGLGTDLAVTHLLRLTRKARTARFRRLAQKRAGTLAAARGLDPARLADRTVPHLGLGADGRMTLDHGPRRFTVSLDEQLRPWVADQRGRRLARLPAPAAADDPVLAADAARRFADLRREVKPLAEERVRALEDAMVSGRRWTAAEFRRLFVDHPVMWHLTHRLLWLSDRGLFRVAEDRTFADVDDKPWELDRDATVAVAHPWHFAADRANWSALFADYAVIQPFPQVGRELFDAAEARPETLTGRPVETRAVRALTARGWWPSGIHPGVRRDWPGGPSVDAELSVQEPHRLTAVRVWWPDGTDAALTDLPPIALSEVARDLRLLTS